MQRTASTKITYIERRNEHRAEDPPPTQPNTTVPEALTFLRQDENSAQEYTNTQRHKNKPQRKAQRSIYIGDATRSGFPINH